MTISRTNLHSSRVTTSGGVAISATTASFTPTADSLLVVCVGAVNGPASSLATGLTSISGGGLTWTKRKQVGQVGVAGFNYSGTCEIWTAPVGSSPSSMTVVAAGGTSDTDPARVTFEIFSLTGVDGTTPVGATASGNPSTLASVSITLDAAPATDSLVIASRFVTPQDTTACTATQGTGWTEVYESPAGSGGYGDIQTQERTGSTSTTVTWDDYVVEGISLDVSAAIAVEFKAAPTGNSGSVELSPLAVSGSGNAADIVTGTGTVALSPIANDGVAIRTGRGIRYIGAGTTIYSTASGTSVAPTYPASLAANDLLVLLIGQKPSAANGGTVTTPSGWTLQGSLTGAGGYSTTLGVDTGNTNVFVYTKDSVAGTESGALTVTVGTNGVCWGSIQAFRAGSGQWSVAVVTGSDTSAGDVSVTLSSDPGVTQYDAALIALCIPTDVTTPSQFSNEAITQTGVTYGTVVEISEPDSSTGNDIGGLICWCPVASGTSSAAPVFTATVAGTNTNVRGPLAFVRIRELGTDGLATGALSQIAVSGSGTSGSASPDGSGSVAASPIAASGTGGVSLTGTGSVALSSAAISGSGTQGVTYPSIINLASGFVVWGSGPNTQTTNAITTTAGSKLYHGIGLWEWYEEFTAGNQARDRTDPTDSKSNSWALLGTVSRPDNWTSAGEGVWVSGPAGSRGASHTFTKIFGNGSEVSMVVSEVANAGTESDYTIYHVANPGSANPTLNLGNVHASGPGLLIVDFYGDQYCTADSVADGWDLVYEYRATSSSIHQARFARTVTSAGDYACSVSMTGIAQGATAISWLVNVIPSGATGSGSVALSQLAASGSGAELFTGSSSVSLQSLAMSGSGIETFTGSASTSLSPLATSGSGIETFAGSGSVALTPVSTSGASLVTCTGSGAVAIQSPTADGSGNQAAGATGSGSLSLSSVACSGTGLESFSGSCSVSMSPLAASGAGLEAFTGTASLAFSQLSVAGSGSELFSGSGIASLANLAASGSGLETFIGSGSLAFVPISVSASGSQAVGIVGSGNAALQSLALSGSGIESFIGGGSLALQSISVSGSGVFLSPVSGSGTVSIQPISALGTGIETFTGSGSVSVSSLSVSGSSIIGFLGSGSVALSSISVASSGSLAYTGTGTVALTALGIGSSGSIVPPSVSGSGALSITSLAIVGSGFIGVVGPGTITRERIGFGVGSRTRTMYGTITRVVAL